MNPVKRLLVRLGWLDRPGDEVEREIEEELQFHLELRTDANIASGMDPRGARVDALRRLGDIDGIRITGRRVLAGSPPPRRRGGFFDSLRQELRNALRIVRMSPGFAATVVLVLALGIGATSTIFSVLNAVLLRPLPFTDPDRLVQIGAVWPNGRWDHPAPGLVVEWKERSKLFEGVEWGAGSVSDYTLAGYGEAVSVGRQWVGQRFFELLGVEPILGRLFAPSELQQNQSTTVVLSHEFWSRHFGGDPEVLGKTVDLMARPRLIVGVMPPGFRTNPADRAADVWMVRDWSGSSFRAPTIGRLQPGVGLEQAAAELQGIAEGVDAEGENGPRVELWEFTEMMSDNYGQALYFLSALVGFVLLICCANVGGLLLMRGAGRQRQIATRLALGAGRSRLARELLAESTLLALLGGAAGVLVTFWGIKLFVAFVPDWYSATETFRIDLKVLGFVLAASLLAGILSGLMPALRVSATDLMATLKKGSRGRSRRQRRYTGGSSFVVVEVAIAVVLLVGAGLMINSVMRIANVDMGFEPAGLAKMSIRVQGSAYQTTESTVLRVTPNVASFYQRLLDRVAALPGVESVGLVSGLPGGGRTSGGPFEIVGRTAPREERSRQRGVYQEINADYFRTMGIPLLRGRHFNARDGETAPRVAIVNDTLARQSFPGEDPLGKFIRADLTAGAVHPDLVGDEPREIVGVVGSTKRFPTADPLPVIYVPFQQHLAVYPDSGPWAVHVIKDVVIRTSSDPATFVGPLQRLVGEVDDTQVAYDVRTMEEQLFALASAPRFLMRFLGICAGVAIMLAALGLYAVIAQSVTQRTHEFGVRMALGAERASVQRLILRQGLVLVLLGAAIGTAGALGLSRVLSSYLYGITPTDPSTFAAVVLALIGVALLACYIPSRRATRVDPLIALRHE